RWETKPSTPRAPLPWPSSTTTAGLLPHLLDPPPGPTALPPLCSYFLSRAASSASSPGPLHLRASRSRRPTSSNAAASPGAAPLVPSHAPPSTAPGCDHAFLSCTSSLMPTSPPPSSMASPFLPVACLSSGNAAAPAPHFSRE
uniref:Uncharacterized protein n=1 Tax=Triticum urartu TaxID=4572 RepID=A0A8R7QSK3_TRIUA